MITNINNKPNCELVNEDGNINSIINLVKNCLIENQEIELLNKFKEESIKCCYYDDILSLSMRYIIINRLCPLCNNNLHGYLKYINRNKDGWIYKCNKCYTWFIRTENTGIINRFNKLNNNIKINILNNNSIKNKIMKLPSKRNSIINNHDKLKELAIEYLYNKKCKNVTVEYLLGNYRLDVIGFLEDKIIAIECGTICTKEKEFWDFFSNKNGNELYWIPYNSEHLIKLVDINII